MNLPGMELVTDAAQVHEPESSKSRSGHAISLADREGDRPEPRAVDERERWLHTEGIVCE